MNKLTLFLVAIAFGIVIDKTWTSHIRPFLLNTAWPFVVALFNRMRRK